MAKRGETNGGAGTVDPVEYMARGDDGRYTVLSGGVPLMASTDDRARAERVARHYRVQLATAWDGARGAFVPVGDLP